MIRHEDIDDGHLCSKLHKVSCCPGVCPPCNFMWHSCRKAVSGKKRRFQKEGFDLDLVYLTPRIIVHGFPADGIETVYRNPRYEMRRFLDTYHKDKYMLYNFCCEPGRGYNPDIFHGRVERYPFKDHNTPPLDTMVAFANSGKYWLDQNPEHVVSMHCKAGKGRAGLMSCVMLLRSGFAQTAKEALDHYDRTRVTNNKGLTVPSQRKFVIFYESLWRDHWGVQGNLGDIPGEPAESQKWKLPEQPMLQLLGVEVLNAPDGLLKNIRIRIYRGTNFLPELLFDTGKVKGHSVSVDCDCNIHGNFKVAIETKKGMFGGSAKVMELWHNTLFMDRNAQFIDFDVSQIDTKRAFRKKLGDKIGLRLKFVKDIDPQEGTASKKKGYEVVPTSEIEMPSNDGDKAAPEENSAQI